MNSSLLKTSPLIIKAQKFVRQALQNNLAKELTFHNWAHTSLVVQGVRRIGLQTKLSYNELRSVILAAIFHDIGYIEKYQGHETSSVSIATDFLSIELVDDNTILQVQDCIMATKFPQQPLNTMQQVLCDADLFHLSLDGYQQFADALKLELELAMGFIYTQREWDKINFNFLKDHSYFTPYGKQVLELDKRKNIAKTLARFTKGTII